MARFDPPYTAFDYQVSRNPDGTPYVGRYADGGSYYNVLAIRVGASVTNPRRVVARTDSLDAAQALTDALIRYTKRGALE